MPEGGKMSKQRKDINLIGKKLNPEAVELANRELLKNNPQLYDYSTHNIRKLNLGWSDYLYRKEWMNAYIKYSKLKIKKPVEGLISDQKWNKVEVSIKISWWSSPKKFSFQRAVSEVEKCYECLDVAIDTHKKINADQWIVSYFSELFGEVSLSNIISWSKIGKGNLKICRMAYNKTITEDYHIRIGTKNLKDAVHTLNKIDKMLVQYRSGVEKGAERSIMGIEIIISVLSSLVGAGAVGLAGKALSNYKKFQLAAEFVKNRRVLKVLVEAGKLGIEAALSESINSGAELISLYRSNRKIDWAKITSKAETGFIKSFISGGLEKIFLLKIFKPKFLNKIPTKSAFLQKYGIDLSKEAISVFDYFVKTINSMSVETIYLLMFKKVNNKNKGKKMTLKMYLDNMAIELLKFNLGAVAKSSRGL